MAGSFWSEFPPPIVTCPFCKRTTATPRRRHPRAYEYECLCGGRFCRVPGHGRKGLVYCPGGKDADLFTPLTKLGGSMSDELHPSLDWDPRHPPEDFDPLDPPNRPLTMTEAVSVQVHRDLQSAIDEANRPD